MTATDTRDRLRDALEAIKQAYDKVEEQMEELDDDLWDAPGLPMDTFTDLQESGWKARDAMAELIDAMQMSINHCED